MEVTASVPLLGDPADVSTNGLKAGVDTRNPPGIVAPEDEGTRSFRVRMIFDSTTALFQIAKKAGHPG